MTAVVASTSSANSSTSATATTRRGRIALVGAGPGDVDLLTVGGKREIEEADVVLADELVAPSILALARGRVLVADKHERGQDPGQQRLNVAALDALRRGERVVRLKSGDPFLYGRGGEELTFFRANGFEARVLPGVSSALAAPALAEISVTHRGVADQLLILAAHGRGGALPDIPAYNARRTLVFLMVAKRVERVAADCTARDYPSTLPAAVIERAATVHQRVIRGTLADIGELAARAVLVPPATLIVGHVVARTMDPAFCSMLGDAPDTGGDV